MIWHMMYNSCSPGQKQAMFFAETFLLLERYQHFQQIKKHDVSK